MILKITGQTLKTDGTGFKKQTAGEIDKAFDVQLLWNAEETNETEETGKTNRTDFGDRL